MDVSRERLANELRTAAQIVEDGIPWLGSAEGKQNAANIVARWRALVAEVDRASVAQVQSGVLDG